MACWNQNERSSLGLYPIQSLKSLLSWRKIWKNLKYMRFLISMLYYDFLRWKEIKLRLENSDVVILCIIIKFCSSLTDFNLIFIICFFGKIVITIIYLRVKNLSNFSMSEIVKLIRPETSRTAKLVASTIKSTTLIPTTCINNDRYVR